MGKYLFNRCSDPLDTGLIIQSDDRFSRRSAKALHVRVIHVILFAANAVHRSAENTYSGPGQSLIGGIDVVHAADITQYGDHRTIGQFS